MHNTTAAYAYSKLVDILHQQAIWSQSTFGPDTEIGPVGSLKHLEKEAKEAYTNPEDKTEYANCFLLILDAVRRQGMTILELFEIAYKKLEEDKKRQWPEYKRWHYEITYDGTRYCCQAKNGNSTLIASGSTALEAKAEVQKLIRQHNNSFVEQIS